MTEVQLKISSGPDASLTQLGHAFDGSRPFECLEELVLCGLKLGPVRQAGLIQDGFGGAESLLVERQDPAHKVTDKPVKLGLRQRAIYPSISLGHNCIEVLPAEDDLDRPCAPYQQRQALQRAPTGYESGADFWLTEDGSFRAGKSDIAGHGEFASASAHPAADDGDAKDVALGEADCSIDPARLAETAARLG